MNITTVGFDLAKNVFHVACFNIAAQKYVYNQEHLKLVGTEGGDWEFHFNAPETKTDLAEKTINMTR